MNQRKLGDTGINVSEIAFGAVEIGMPYGIGVHSKEDMPDENDAIRLLQAAFDAGINFIDTGRHYGKSENIIGKAFRQNRDAVVIATKCLHLGDLSEATSSTIRESILNSLHDSLDALQTDFVDIYMMHDSDPKVLQHPDVLETFSKLKAAGTIRATGISTYTPEETRTVIESGNWDVVQVPFNLLDQRHETLFGLAAKNGVGIVIRSVLMKGLLSNRGRNLHPALSSVEKKIEQLQTFARQMKTSLPALATRFALSFPEVASVLVGLDKFEYLNQSLEVANGKYFSNNDLEEVRRLAFEDPKFLNLHEWNVKGWLV